MPGKHSTTRGAWGTKKKTIRRHQELSSWKRLEMLNLERKLIRGDQRSISITQAKRNQILHYLRVQKGYYKCKRKLTRSALKKSQLNTIKETFWLKGSHYTLTSLPLKLLKSCVASQTKNRSHVFNGARSSKSQGSYKKPATRVRSCGQQVLPTHGCQLGRNLSPQPEPSPSEEILN